MNSIFNLILNEPFNHVYIYKKSSTVFSAYFLKKYYIFYLVKFYMKLVIVSLFFN